MQNENKTERQNLQFITSQKFKSQKKYVKWYCELSPKQQTIINRLEFKLPELITIAENYYDFEKSKGGALFELISETLNVK